MPAMLLKRLLLRTLPLNHKVVALIKQRKVWSKPRTLSPLPPMAPPPRGSKANRAKVKGSKANRVRVRARVKARVKAKGEVVTLALVDKITMVANLARTSRSSCQGR